MPAPLVIGAGVVGSVALEYALSRGQASNRELVVAGTVGALPVGLGARGTMKLGQKLWSARHLRQLPKGHKTAGALYAFGSKTSPVFIGNEARQVALAMGASAAVGSAYDRYLAKQTQSSSAVSSSRRGRGGRPPSVPTRPTKSTRQRRRSKPARRMRAKKWCPRHKRYDYCR